MKKSILKFDEITKLCLINFFLNLFFLSPVAVFFYQQRGLNYFQILSLESILVLFIFFFEVPTGILADKFGRKKSIIAGTLLLTISPIFFVFAESYFLFAIAFAISGIGITFHSGIIEAFIYDHLKSQNKEKEMKKAMGSFGSTALVAMVIAPIIGSYIAKDLFMSQFIFVILMTVGAAFVGFLLSLLLKDTGKKEYSEENPFLLFKSGVKIVGKNKSLLRIILLSVFTSHFLFTLNYLYQPYFQISGVDTAIFGTIFAIALLLSALFQKYAYKFEEKIGMKKAVFLATIIPGIFYIAMAFVFHPIFAIILFVFIRAIMGLKAPLFSEYKNIHIPSKNRATILSLVSMLVALYLVGMRLVIGKLADINLSYAFLLMGGIIIIASIVLRIDEKNIINNQEA